MDYRQIYAIQNENKKRILKICPNANENSGIYIFTREENGIRFGYVGLAKHLLTRLASHLVGYKTKNPTHIDKSLKKHGLWSEENPTGWKVSVRFYDESELNEKEQFYIKQYANYGYQLRNKTSGSQGQGKTQIAEYKPPKTYTEGKIYGRQQLAKELKHIIDNYLKIELQKENKLSQKMLEKFNKLLGEKI